MDKIEDRNFEIANKINSHMTSSLPDHLESSAWKAKYESSKGARKIENGAGQSCQELEEAARADVYVQHAHDDMHVDDSMQDFAFWADLPFSCAPLHFRAVFIATF